MEQALITGVSADRSLTRLTLTGLPASPSALAQVFRLIANAGLPFDMVTSCPSATAGRIDLCVAAPAQAAPLGQLVLLRRRAELDFAELRQDEHVGAVSLLGAGLRSCQGLVATFCATLSTVSVTVNIMSISDIRLSALCHSSTIDAALDALRSTFGLCPDTADVPVGAEIGPAHVANGAIAEFAGVRR